MSRVQTVTAEDFSREALFSPVPVVVDVYADWCAPCRALAPLIERLAEHFAGRIKFLKLNIDDNPDIAEALRVEGVPTLLMFQGGQLSHRVVGLSDPRKLVEQLENLAGSAPALKK